MVLIGTSKFCSAFSKRSVARHQDIVSAQDIERSRHSKNGDGRHGGDRRRLFDEVKEVVNPPPLTYAPSRTAGSCGYRGTSCRQNELCDYVAK
jgi:hypothetical protein